MCLFGIIFMNIVSFFFTFKTGSDVNQTKIKACLSESDLNEMLFLGSAECVEKY